MRKNTFTFRHDYGARNDPKIQDLLFDIGPSGLGVYWVAVEMLYEQGGYLPKSSYKQIAYAAHSTESVARKVVESFDLFHFDDKNIWSERVIDELEKIKRINEIHYRSANSEWNDDEKNYLRSLSYTIFLRTRYWRDVSLAVKIRAGNRCELCRSTNGLEVHHLSYKHHGDEINHLEDLICLCHNCHTKEHGYEK